MKTKILLVVFSILLLTAAVASAESKEDRKRIQAYEQKVFAERFEKEMLLKGFDVHVKVSDSVLMVKWNGVSRPFVYQFASNKDTLAILLKHGFYVVMFYNGFGDHWSVLQPYGDIQYFSTKIK